ncbi:hypothetical protein [Pseudoalteromonas marina]|uniref:Uncharacterized protein n=1 Tax=Pseudoalteromonas marina TaxID=267375 RepID=A0ABT9FHY2_9GAMM|nr:hypothetical protein [Pseudoalteromonas marina]MDP2566389.1 hypothetical protein [Pseudoalteromonas marina]
MKYQYADSKQASDLIASIVTGVNTNTDYLSNVPERLRELLKNFMDLYIEGAEMFAGVEGLPKTTAKLVELGVCYIEGNFVYLHPAICDAVIEKNLRRDRLLEKLKNHPANAHLDLD